MSVPVRGYIDIQDRRVTWRGLGAVYSVAEEREMRGLPEREALVLHTLKAVFGGEIMNPDDASLRLDRPTDCLEPPQNDQGLAPAAVNTADKQWRTRRRGEPEAHGQTAIAD